MSKLDNGGPAYPVAATVISGDQWVYEQEYRSVGVTVRDYFAVKALQGLLTSAFVGGKADIQFARQAYKYADLMLQVRDE